VFRDNIPAIILAEWELSAEYFDEDFMSGVMPVLFARDPRAAEAGIKANPETAMKDLDKLNRIFLYRSPWNSQRPSRSSKERD
jgi:hypothetical protein